MYKKMHGIEPLLVCLIAMLFSLTSNALMIHETDDGKALVVRDCGIFEDSKQCLDHLIGFNGEGKYIDLSKRDYWYNGDAFYLEQSLKQKRYVRVIFISQGGSVYEGYKVGKLLKKYQVDAVVPKGFFCISACTFAFLGGFVRSVDESATFEVHSASARGLLDPIEGQIPLFNVYGDNFDGFLNKYTTKQATSIADFMIYLQEMYGGHPDERMIREITSNSIDNFKAAFRASANYKNDQNAYDYFNKHQDLSALESAFMHVERDSAIFYIDQLKAKYTKINSGTAKFAIKFMETMYKTSDIRGTNPLSRAELKEMNIVNDR